MTDDEDEVVVGTGLEGRSPFNGFDSSRPCSEVGCREERDCLRNVSILFN